MKLTVGRIKELVNDLPDETPFHIFVTFPDSGATLVDDELPEFTYVGHNMNIDEKEHTLLVVETKYDINTLADEMNKLNAEDEAEEN